MSNSLLNVSKITREAMRILVNNLVAAGKINKQYSKEFSSSGAKIGSVINIRKPVRYTVSSGKTLDLQNQTDQSEALTLDSQRHVDFQFSSQEMKLNIEDFGKRYLKPGVAALANNVDNAVCSLYKQVYQSTGTPGTTPNAFSYLTDTGTKLSNAAAPLDSRCMILNPAASGAMADGLKGLFHSTERIKEQYEKGMMGLAGGFENYMDQNIQQHTNGTYAGTPVVNGASQSGASLVTDGWSSTSLKEGDVFTIANVNAVNPQTRQSTGQLQQFVVTADISDTAGDMTIAISPSITTSGQYQTVNAAPADNAAITMVGSSATLYPQNIAFHPDAFVLGTADLPLPDGVDFADRVSDEQTGLSIRVVRAYDINNDEFPCRMDILYGVKAVYPELACRLWG